MRPIKIQIIFVFFVYLVLASLSAEYILAEVVETIIKGGDRLGFDSFIAIGIFLWFLRLLIRFDIDDFKDQNKKGGR